MHNFSLPKSSKKEASQKKMYLLDCVCQIVVALPNNLTSKSTVVEALWAAFLPSIIKPTLLWKHIREYLRRLFMTLDLATRLNAQQFTQREETSGLDWPSQRLVTGNTCMKTFKALIWFLQRILLPATRGYVHINCIYG